MNVRNPLFPRGRTALCGYEANCACNGAAAKGPLPEAWPACSLASPDSLRGTVWLLANAFLPRTEVLSRNTPAFLW